MSWKRKREESNLIKYHLVAREIRRDSEIFVILKATVPSMIANMESLDTSVSINRLSSRNPSDLRMTSCYIGIDSSADLETIAQQLDSVLDLWPCYSILSICSVCYKDWTDAFLFYALLKVARPLPYILHHYSSGTRTDRLVHILNYCLPYIKMLICNLKLLFQLFFLQFTYLKERKTAWSEEILLNSIVTLWLVQIQHFDKVICNGTTWNCICKDISCTNMF